jgi:hypothetical protein
MPKAPVPNWRQRKEPILDSYVKASIDATGGKYDETTGWYGTLVYTGCETRERAMEIRQALYRSAFHLKVSLATDIKKHDNTFDVVFTAINKAHGKAYVIERYGSDRKSFPYDPRAKAVKA